MTGGTTASVGAAARYALLRLAAVVVLLAALPVAFLVLGGIAESLFWALAVASPPGTSMYVYGDAIYFALGAAGGVLAAVAADRVVRLRWLWGLALPLALSAVLAVGLFMVRDSDVRLEAVALGLERPAFRPVGPDLALRPDLWPLLDRDGYRQFGGAVGACAGLAAAVAWLALRGLWRRPARLAAPRTPV